MTDRSAALERVPTGVPGLDRVLGGGLLAAGVYIVQGPPGAGKTILANQLCFNRAAAGEQVVYVTLLAESHARMFAHLRQLEFFDERAVPDRIYYVGAFTTLEAEGLKGVVQLVRGTITKRSASLLVIDGLVSAQESAADDRQFKKFLHELQLVADLTGCLIVLLTNAERHGGAFPEHTMVDGVLHLTDELSALRPFRHLRVLKLRGSNPLRGLHSVRISDAGFAVRPRLETGGVTEPVPNWEIPSAQKCGFDLPELDTMLRGGVRQGSMTMLLGPSGSGKTLLAMQFLSAGLKRGERGLYFGFFEHPNTILAKCRRIGIGGIAEGVEDGRARVIWTEPVEGIVDDIGQRLFDEVRTTRPARVVIDGMQGFEQAADFPERVAGVYAAIAHELERMGVTTVYTSESRGLFDADIDAPVTGLSAATQNILLIRYIERRAAILRTLAILKVRDDDYDSRMRELRITDAGIHLLDNLVDQSHLISGGDR